MALGLICARSERTGGVPRAPRVRCDEHGVRQARVPWAEPKSRFTLMFERFAIDVLRETDVQGATELLRISWDQAHHIMQRVVERGLARRAEPERGVEHGACEGRKD